MTDQDDRSSESRDHSLPRRPFLGTIGGAAAGTLAGCFGGGNDDEDDHSDWPDVDDPYYATLIEDLSEMELPAAEFVYADSEAETAAAYGLGSDIASSEDLDVGDEVPFSEARRIEVDEAGDPWDATLVGNVGDRDVSTGDALLGVAYLRAPEGEAELEYVAKDDDNMQENFATVARPEIGQEWQRYYVPVGYGADAAAGTWWTEFWTGFREQVVDVGGIALLDFGDAVDVGALPSGAAGDAGDPGGISEDDGWEEEANQRIQEHRTAELAVEVTDAAGDPIDGATVDVEMREHEFGFGVAVEAPVITGDDGTVTGDDREQYLDVVTELFDTAVLGNYHKWRFWENEAERGGDSISDEATAWLLDRGMELRGHTCLWANVDAWAVPPDVVSAMGVEWPENGVEDPEYDPDHVRERSFDHVERIVEHYDDFRDYGSAIEEWDVVNEVLHEPEMIRAIEGDGPDDQSVDPTQADVLAEWYRTAAAAADADVAVNDYNTLEGPYRSTRDDYEQQIDFLLEEDVALDGVGLQSHFSRSEALSPDDTWDALETYAEGRDVGLRITEFDMADENWPEEDKAEFFHGFLKTAFSHPDVTDFVLWGFWDAAHWRDDAPLFYDDWEPKPSHDVYTDLVFDEWWTEEAGETDGDGRFELDSAFLGEYEITVERDGETVTETVIVDDDATVELSLDE